MKEIEHLFSIWAYGDSKARPFEIKEWFEKHENSICAPSYSSIMDDIKRTEEGGKNTKAVEDLLNFMDGDDNLVVNITEDTPNLVLMM